MQMIFINAQVRIWMFALHIKYMQDAKNPIRHKYQLDLNN